MIEIVKAVSEYGILIVLAAVFILVFWQDRRERREDTKDFRAKQEKWYEQSTAINAKLSDIIAHNNIKIDGYNEALNSHCQESGERFGRIEGTLVTVVNKLDVIQDSTQELATKTMLEEVKQEIINSEKSKKGKD